VNTVQHREALFNFDRHGRWLLACPECGCQWTHLQRVYALEGSDPFEGGSEHGELYGVPVGGVSEFRRGCLVMEFWGECSHRFTVELQQHRGETFIEPRILREGQ
jgi:hypothetical protein